MKNKIIITILLASLQLATSCSKWLDVQPETEKDRAELIKTENGYKQMLYGTYINLTSSSLYGDNLTYGLISGLARDYVYRISYNTATRKDYDYQQASLLSPITSIWSTMYNNIANVNSILQNIENDKSLFYDNEGDLVEGEMRAMRAFMHFDLLRMFAPSYTVAPDTIAIPYVETFETARYPHIKSSDVMTKIMTDLDKAEELLKSGNDPLIAGKQDITYSGKGQFTANRQYRFNYWAVIALKARVYLYMGDETKALEYANKVINEGPFTWTPENEIAMGDKVFQSELIMGLEVTSLPDYFDANFRSERYCLYGSTYSGQKIYTDMIFDDNNDYRYMYLITNDKFNSKTIPGKYLQTNGSGKTMKKQTIPLIRYGEMILIAAECQLKSNPAKTIELLRDLRLHRGYLSTDCGVSSSASQDALADIISKEMRKDTYLEGQMWFYLKRTGATKVPYYATWGGNTTSISEEMYTFPMSESEKEYGLIPSDK